MSHGMSESASRSMASIMARIWSAFSAGTSTVLGDPTRYKEAHTWNNTGVTWVNNKGGPHNVVFDEDAIPSGVDAGSISQEEQIVLTVFTLLAALWSLNFVRAISWSAMASAAPPPPAPRGAAAAPVPSPLRTALRLSPHALPRAAPPAPQPPRAQHTPPRRRSSSWAT